MYVAQDGPGFLPILLPHKNQQILSSVSLHSLYLLLRTDLSYFDPVWQNEITIKLWTPDIRGPSLVVTVQQESGLPDSFLSLALICTLVTKC